MTRTCKNCEWWQSAGIEYGDESALCKRHPPTVSFHGGEGWRGYWPKTRSFDWCGEFKQKDKSE